MPCVLCPSTAARRAPGSRAFDAGSREVALVERARERVARQAQHLGDALEHRAAHAVLARVELLEGAREVRRERGVPA